MGLACNGYVMI